MRPQGKDIFSSVVVVLAALTLLSPTIAAAESMPNILFCISDDQSYAHTGANGDPVVKTPAFDRVAREGIRFTRAFCDAPTCGPSRSAILTGQHIWRLEEAGNIHSTLPAKFTTYTEMLQKAGYVASSVVPAKLEPRQTRVAWRCEFGESRRRRVSRLRAEFCGLSLKKKAKDQPFCFWLGSLGPTSADTTLGSGVESGKDPQQVIVPPYLSDHPVVRGDILDYYVEIERFDQMEVANAMALLEEFRAARQHHRGRHQRSRHAFSARQGQSLRCRHPSASGDSLAVGNQVARTCFRGLRESQRLWRRRFWMRPD